MTALRQACPDFHLTVEDLAVDGEEVWLRMRGSGTNDGPSVGHPPSGRKMQIDVFDVLRFQHGRMVEHWGVSDRLTALLQLGAYAGAGRVCSFRRRRSETWVWGNTGMSLAQEVGRCFMEESETMRARATEALWVPAGDDVDGERRGLGISVISFKVTPRDGLDLLVLENTFHAPGGPPRHLHEEQEEVFYALDGEFVIEIGDERRSLRPGDVVLAPRQVPHVWASVGDAGRILITFSPAGRMEGFFREVTSQDAMPGQDPELWRRHGMRIVGPPLELG